MSMLFVILIINALHNLDPNRKKIVLTRDPVVYNM